MSNQQATAVPKPPHVVFAFGPNAYFYERDGVHKWQNLAPSLLRLLTETGPGAVKRTLCVSLKENNGYFIVYENQMGRVKCVCQNIPQNLKDFIQTRNNRSFPSGYSLESLRVSLFPGGFFSTAVGSYGARRYRWEGLSRDANAALKRCLSKDANSEDCWRFVVGQEGKFILYQTAKEGSAVWVHNISNGPILELDIVLNPYDDAESDRGIGEYFLRRPDGSVELSAGGGFDLYISGDQEDDSGGVPVTLAESPGAATLSPRPAWLPLQPKGSGPGQHLFGLPPKPMEGGERKLQNPPN